MVNTAIPNPNNIKKALKKRSHRHSASHTPMPSPPLHHKILCPFIYMAVKTDYLSSFLYGIHSAVEGVLG